MKDKVIIITGASAGIGKSLSQQLGKMGAKVVLAARDEGALNSLSAEIPGSLVVPTDVTDSEACKHLIERTLDHFGRLDILVNNAGLSMWTLFDQITDLSIFSRIMQVNYLGSVYCTHYALPHLKQSKGLIVAISSLAGKTGVPTRSGYSASKHAMQGFFDTLRIELMGSGVDVCVVSPGFVQSEIRSRALGPDGKPLGKSPIDEPGVMPVEDCAAQIIAAMQARKRELIMGSLRIRIGMWLRLIAPSIVDNMARKAIQTGRS